MELRGLVLLLLRNLVQQLRGTLEPLAENLVVHKRLLLDVLGLVLEQLQEQEGLVGARLWLRLLVVDLCRPQILILLGSLGPGHIQKLLGALNSTE